MYAHAYSYRILAVYTLPTRTNASTTCVHAHMHICVYICLSTTHSLCALFLLALTRRPPVHMHMCMYLHVHISSYICLGTAHSLCAPLLFCIASIRQTTMYTCIGISLIVYIFVNLSWYRRLPCMYPCILHPCIDYL